MINYVQYMLTTFALYEVNKFDWKPGKIFSASRKYYAVDTGLINSYPGATHNYSKQLENLVFSKLKRLKRQSIYFGSAASNKEIDFIVQHRDGSLEKDQVTQTLHDDNYERKEIQRSTFNYPKSILSIQTTSHRNESCNSSGFLIWVKMTANQAGAQRDGSNYEQDYRRHIPNIC